MRVRLTHPLGTAEFDLSDRTIDDPVVIGRAAEADLKVPSINVARQHAVLFVHEGEWVVQDAGSKDGTYVNGVRLDGPARLGVGSKISLGSDANSATVEVLSVEPALVAPSAEVAAVADVPFDVPFDVPPAPGVATPRPPARRKPTRGPIVFAGIGGLLMIVAVIGSIWGYYVFTDKVAKNEAILSEKPKTEVIVKKSESESQRKTIFMQGSGATSPATKPAEDRASAPAVKDPDSSVMPPVPPTPVAPVASEPEPAKPEAASDPAWDRVLEFRDSSPAPLAIYQYVQYRTQNPDSKHLAELDKIQNNAVDMLWWERINDLVNVQAHIDTDVAELKKEKTALPADTDKDRRDQFDRQVKDLLATKEINRLLLENEMGYKSPKPIDLDDTAALTALRAQRDKAAFDRFSQRVLSRVKNTRGAAAW